MSASKSPAAADRAVLLALGGNVGDREAILREAIRRIDALDGVGVTKVSQFYRTAPWGMTEQDWFLNGCLAAETTLEPSALLAACKAIEADLGRVDGPKWGPRPIDIDLIDMQGVQFNAPNLTLPHPHVLERAFVLVPLADIAADWLIGGITVADALAAIQRSPGDVIALTRSP